jgi:hypothetical protein
MSRRADRHIPHDILEAAKAAGLSTPVWYVGRSNGHEDQPITKGVHDIVIEARQREGLAEHDVPDVDTSPPVQPDRFPDDD